MTHTCDILSRPPEPAAGVGTVGVAGCPRPYPVRVLNEPVRIANHVEAVRCHPDRGRGLARAIAPGSGSKGVAPPGHLRGHHPWSQSEARQRDDLIGIGGGGEARYLTRCGRPGCPIYLAQRRIVQESDRPQSNAGTTEDRLRTSPPELGQFDDRAGRASLVSGLPGTAFLGDGCRLAFWEKELP